MCFFCILIILCFSYNYTGEIMKKILFVIIFLFMFSIKVNASTTSAHSYTLMDMSTGRVLSSKSKDEPMLIASISKIMIT